MAAITRLGMYGGPRPVYVGFTAATAAVTVAVSFANEDQIRAGGHTITLTLVNDTWVTFNDTIRQAIIDGLTSAGSELLGWNNEVRDKEVPAAVVRDSDSQVSITLTAAPLYDITANETITVTVPASAFTTSSAPVVATPTFAVAFVAAVEATGGWIRRRPDEETAEERRRRIQAERERLGITAPERRPSRPPDAAQVPEKPTLRLRPDAGPNTLDEAELEALLGELEAMEADAQAELEAETELEEERRRRLAIVLLLAA